MNQIIHTSAQDMEDGAGEEPPPLYQIGGVAIAAATRRKKHVEARKDKDFLAIIIPYSTVSFHENLCFAESLCNVYLYQSIYLNHTPSIIDFLLILPIRPDVDR